MKAVVTTFWKRYGGKVFDSLKPKLAIYAANVSEAVNEVKPALEEILVSLDIPLSSVLVNIGDTKYTKNEDIRDFNNLDVAGTTGNDKQFIILVEKERKDGTVVPYLALRFTAVHNPRYLFSKPL